MDITVILEICSENSTKYIFLHDYDIHIGGEDIQLFGCSLLIALCMSCVIGGTQENLT